MANYTLNGTITDDGITAQEVIVNGNTVSGQIIGGPRGEKGDKGDQGIPGVVQAVVAGTGISVDDTDPANPIVTNTQTSANWGNITGTLSAQTDLQSALNNKVDVVSGKGLSTNDYTTAEKTKLSGIATGAEVNVNADWSAGSGDAQILNKPSLATVATSGSYTDLSNKPTIPAAQINSDWSSVSGVSQILNKPTIPTKTSDLTNDSSFITSAGAPVQSVNSKTGAVSLTTADIADSTNKRYVTDAQQTVIGNTSGTNTGDETGATIKSKLGITTLSGSNTGDQDLSGLVPKTTTVNSKALSSNITLNASDIGLSNVTNDAQLKSSQLDTDNTLSANSDSKVPSQKAVKAYADNNFVDLTNDQDVGGIKNFNGGQMHVTNSYEGEDSTVALLAGYGGVLALMVDGPSSEANIILVGYDSSIRFGPGGEDSTDTIIARTDENELSFDGAKLVDTRPIPRVYSTTSSSSLTPDISTYDQYCFTALAAGLAIDTPTGTPQDGEKLLFRIKDNGTARALTWDSIYNGVGVALPTTTTVSKTVYIGAIYNSASSKWDVLLVNTEA